MSSVSAPGRPASLALTDKPERLLVAIEGRLAFLDWASGTWTDWVVLEAADLRNRLNDGRCDPAGRFWVGSMSDPAIASGDGPRPATGLLHRVEADGTAVTVRSGIGVANGLAFAPDGRTMYFADTHRDTVWAYDYDVSTGRGHQRTGLPRLRVHSRAGPTARASTRTAATGSRACTARAGPAGDARRARSIGGSPSPSEKPTMPAFGGPDLSTLFITSIGGGGSHAIDPAQPEAGGLFAIDAGVRGLPEPRFAGSPSTGPA